MACDKCDYVWGDTDDCWKCRLTANDVDGHVARTVQRIREQVYAVLPNRWNGSVASAVDVVIDIVSREIADLESTIERLRPVGVSVSMLREEMAARAKRDADLYASLNDVPLHLNGVPLDPIVLPGTVQTIEVVANILADPTAKHATWCGLVTPRTSRP